MMRGNTMPTQIAPTDPRPSRDRQGASGFPLAYLITFTCYGTRLHGDPRGSVDPKHNIAHTPYLSENLLRVRSEEGRMAGKPYLLKETARRIVLEAIREVCAHRHWSLDAVHVRTNHLHCIVSAETPPERIMNAFKSYTSRRLNKEIGEENGGKRWTRHGSTIYVWNEQELFLARDYVVRKQGEPMTLYVAGWTLPDGRGSDERSIHGVAR